MIGTVLKQYEQVNRCMHLTQCRQFCNRYYNSAARQDKQHSTHSELSDDIGQDQNWCQISGIAASCIVFMASSISCTRKWHHSPLIKKRVKSQHGYDQPRSQTLPRQHLIAETEHEECYLPLNTLSITECNYKHKLTLGKWIGKYALHYISQWKIYFYLMLFRSNTHPRYLVSTCLVSLEEQSAF